MESLPQNPEFRIIPENFHPCRSMGELFVCVNALHPSQKTFHSCCNDFLSSWVEPVRS